MTIKTGCMTYKVDFVDKIATENGNADGQTDYSKQTITLVESLPFERKWLVLLHEYFHAHFDETGHSKLCDDEDAVDAAACAMFQFLDKNENIINLFYDFETRYGE